MHDIKWIINNKEEFDKNMNRRNIGPVSDKIIDLDEERRQLVTLIQQLQHARNEKAALIGQMRDKESFECLQIKKDANDIKSKLVELENRLNNEDKLTNFLSSLPNILDEEVPNGKDETSNQEIRKWGTVPNFDFKAKQHFELGEALGMMDFEQTAKISGSRFVTLKAALARMERALANFMLDIHTEEFGFTEVIPPHLVRNSAMFGAGQLPKFAEDSFVTTDNYRLIPTAEVPLVNLVYDSIVDADKLPLRFTAQSLSFRSEAGSAGKDTRGMIRVHQFSKVELVSITRPEDSAAEHERITQAAETILQRLKLPYRVMLLCAGDTSFTSKRTYDLEVWLPGQNKYREISSCSNCGDFQARRMKARFRPVKGKETVFLHTLNGSGLAIGRTLIAILENYQQKDGSIKVPEALVPYMKGMTVIK
jgi:seryl-tRNA synthetase